MNELVIPSAAQWYKSSIIACSPDNTIVYGSHNDIVILNKTPDNKHPEVQIIPCAHSKHIVSVGLNKKWGDSNKFIVSLSEDSVVKVWDAATCVLKYTSTHHTDTCDSLVGAIFAGDERIVTASTKGLVNIWNIHTNEHRVFNNLFNWKVSLTCLSSCPHASWLLAFGCLNGVVAVVDLRRNGELLYKLRGHRQGVISLSWCPAPINVFPRHYQNYIKGSQPTPTKKSNPWVNLTHVDDDEAEASVQVPAASKSDFLDDCESLKSKILGLEVPEENVVVIKSEDLESTPKIVKKTRTAEASHGRPLPQVFDPSCSFLDNFDNSSIESDKDADDEKCHSRDEASQSHLGGGDAPQIEEDATCEKIDDSNIVSEKEDLEENPKKTDSLEVSQLCEEIAEVSLSTTKDEEPVVPQTVTNPEPVEEEPRSEYLLASCGRDRSVYIWRGGTDGRMQTFFNIPRKSKRTGFKQTNAWITCCWATPNTLLTSSETGELLTWSIPKTKNKAKAYDLVYYEHPTTIFNIATPPKYTTPQNWNDPGPVSVWLICKDGVLVNLDSDTGRINLNYCTITAPINCFDAAPLDPNRLAIGQKDGLLRVWDLSRPNVEQITMQRFQPKGIGRVTSVAWHPTKEMLLSFGTDEGRVGCVDVVTNKTTMFVNFFRMQVHNVEWGPLLGDKDNLAVFALADGKVAIFDVAQASKDPILLKLPEKLFIYRFAWKPDLSFLLLNTVDGSVFILTHNLVAVTTMYTRSKGMNDIVWHPDACTSDLPRSFWFGAASTKGILVYDCKVDGEVENSPGKLVVDLEGHCRAPVALAWSPFNGDHIVSTAPDGLTHVWDVIKHTLLATFADDLPSYSCAVVWSPLDADLIVTGNNVLRVWSISKNPPQRSNEFLATRTALLQKSAIKGPEKIKRKIDVKIPGVKKSAKSSIVPQCHVASDGNFSEQVDSMKMLMAARENPDAQLAHGSDTKIDPFSIFAGKDKLVKMLTLNYDEQKKDGKFKMCEMIGLWKGNMGDPIKEAIEENRVTPTVIALAPMVSPRLWQEACQSYAKHLSEDSNSDPMVTAMYFLACHKVEEAITCLCTNKLFREALALAKCRLPEGSEMIHEITQKLAEDCVQKGNFEMAAFCYISVGQYEAAAKVLARRTNTEFLQFACDLATKANNPALCNSINEKLREEQSKNCEAQEKPLMPRFDAFVKQMNDALESTEAENAISEP